LIGNVTGSEINKDGKQCCGSGMFIPDPGSRIPDSKIAKERGEKKLIVIHPFL
jgi:hypothetical protein